MKPMVRMMTPLRVLIAVAALGYAASASQAGMMRLTLENVSANVPDVFVEVPFDAIGNGSGTGSLSLSGYTLGFTITSAYNPASPSTQSLTLDATFRGSALALDQQLFRITLSGDSYANPQGSTAYLTSALSGTFNGTGNFGTSLNSRGRLVSGLDTYFTAAQAAQGTDVAGVEFLRQSNAVTVTPLATGYSLASISTSIVTTGAGTDVSFTARAAVALPEPGSVVATIAGMPFAIGLVGLLRRRLTHKPTPESNLAV